MPNTIDRELFNRLRAGGLRKRVARVLSEATDAGRGASGRAEQTARKAINDLRALADELEVRLRGATTGASKRSQAAQKAARTRARQASARSTAAKKAAATRAAKSTSGSSRSSSGTTRSRSSSGTTRRRSSSS